MANSHFTCPVCHAQLDVTSTQVSPPTFSFWQDKQTTFQSSTPAPWLNGNAPAGSLTRRIPVRAMSMSSDVWPPLALGLTAGVFGLAGSLLLTVFTDWPLSAAPVVGLAGAFVTWMSMAGVARATLHSIENWTSLDIDHDGSVGAPPPPPVRVEVQTDAGAHWQFADLPGAPGALVDFAARIGRGETFAERTATDAGLTQQQFKELRETFTSRGWCTWNHPTRRQQGVTLARNGRAVLRAIAASIPPQVS